MALVGVASIEVQPTFGQWDRKVRSAVAGPQMGKIGEEGGEAVASGFDRGSSRIVGFLGGVAKAGAAALVAGIGAAGTVGIRTAASLQTAEIAFTTMLGSAEKAKTFLGELGEFAAKTPFDLPGLQKSAQSLISIGIESDKVIPIMTTLGNVTSGMGTGAEGVQRATVALQQMNAAQKISAEDLNQLRDAGIPVYDLLTAATGRSKKELAEMASKGKLGRVELEALMTALESGKGLERFNGMMEAQSQSLTGLWSTLKDTFSVGMAEAVQPLIPLLEDGLGGAIGLVEASVPKLRDGIQWLIDKAPAAGKVFGNIKDAATGLYDLVVGGDYSGSLQKAFGWQEDSPAVDKILDIRDAATGLFDLVFKGDYTGKLRNAFGWEEDSPAVGKILDIRDAVVGFFDSIGSGDMTPLVDGISQIGVVAGDVGATLPALGPTVDLVSDAFAWAADNVDLLAKALPFLVGAFVAVKGAQAANNLVGRESIVGFGLQLASNVAMTVSNITLSRSLNSVNAAQKQVIVQSNLQDATSKRMTLSTVAHTIAEKARTVAAKAGAVAQKALNLVLRANPIGLVITAILALVGVFTVLYNKNETVRRVIDAAWAGIKSAVSSVVNWFTQKAWPAFRGALSSLGTKVSSVYSDYVKPGFDNIRNKVSSVWDSAKSIFGKFKDGLSSLGDRFRSVKNGIADTWGGLVAAVAVPIRGVISFVNDRFLDPLEKALNKIPGVNVNLPTIPVPRTPSGASLRGGPNRALAAGGVLDGYSPGRDDMHFFSPRHGQLSLSGGEGIMVPEWVRGVGRGFIDRMNGLARRGGPGAVRRAMGFATGGIVGGAGNAAPGSSGTGGFLDKGWEWLVDLVKDAGAWVRKKFEGLLSGIGGSWPALGARGAAGAGISGLGSWIRDNIFGGGGGDGGPGRVNYPGRFGQHPTGMHWTKIWALIKSVVPDAIMTSNFRGGAITASGIPSLHGLSRAVDWVTPGLVGMVDAFRRVGRILPWSQHFFTQAGAGSQQGIVDDIIRRTHRDHGHTALAGGGVLSPRLADSGALLPPGDHWIRNQTGHYEILNPRLRGGGSGDAAADLLAALEDFAGVAGDEVYRGVRDGLTERARLVRRQRRAEVGV